MESQEACVIEIRPSISSKRALENWRKLSAGLKKPNKRQFLFNPAARALWIKEQEEHFQTVLQFVNARQDRLSNSRLSLLGSSSGDESRHTTKATSTVWVILLTNLGLETLSAVFDQIASPSKPDYALFGMVLGILAVLICILELIHKGKKEGVELKRWGKLCWFYYPPPNESLFGTFPDICGLVIAISQYICSTVQYVYLCRHANNPIKLSVLPAIFLICLAGSKLIRNRSYTTNETFKHTTHHITKINFCRFWHSV
ncbi:uncharacterized protein LOC112173446 [Rosa chinensis]|uniref:uncharacterized protein LOC112173446 n=1 Tax=Rosa chinensis TaxID=74649 RepID=UPI000D090B29|nr:uncharacterized protein LOC112173446 [Rosa chinensis]